jgi:transcriptional regulator with XRE-family HTH domain
MAGAILSARILEANEYRSQHAGMDKTIHSRQNERVHKMLLALRTKAGLTQRQLAEKLGRERSLVGRLELGERRLDLVEFFWLCRACDADPAGEAARLMQEFDGLQKGQTPEARSQM